MTGNIKKTSVMGIKEFYNGRNIFITGGSGFMGKVLIEKLLRSCPGIDKIYVLMRNGKHKDVNMRVKEMLALPLFEKLEKENPGIAEKKIIPVIGNLTEIKLGLNTDDYNTLIKNVSIVFHVAATVRFNEPLRDAIIHNVRGTREVVRLAKQMETLKVFLHVSTTYCNCNRIKVDEKVYESPVSWQDAILIAENMDPKISDICSTQFLGPFPNTYTLTKLMAEQIINEESTQNCNNDSMPMIIFRPSVVVSSINEPIDGWIDNINGPTGLMVATGKGVSQVILSHKDVVTDFMPVDISIKAMIVAVYHLGTHNSLLNKELPVYNSSSARDITHLKLVEFAVKYFIQHPFDDILWRPRVFVANSIWVFNVLTIILQVIPAIFIDRILKATGKKTINLVKLQQKIYLALIALSYFSLQTWMFNNTKYLSLLKCIPDSEKQDFDFSINYDNEKIFETFLIGAQKYLFKNDPKNVKQTAKKLKTLIWLDKLLRIFFFFFFFWCLIKTNIFSNVNKNRRFF